MCALLSPPPPWLPPQVFHVGLFPALLTLSLAKNFIVDCTKGGLPHCPVLHLLDLSGNKLEDPTK